MPKTLLTTLMCVAVIATNAPALASSSSDQSETERKLEESAKTLLDGLNLLLNAIPWYGAPEVLPNGDIIIPRIDAPSLPKSKRRDNETEEDIETKKL